MIALKKAETIEKTETVETVPVFSKDSILKSKRYAYRRDALKALLRDEESYTLEQVEKILNDFMNEEVK